MALMGNVVVWKPASLSLLFIMFAPILDSLHVNRDGSLFERYYRLMFGVCMRYVSDKDACGLKEARKLSSEFTLLDLDVVFKCVVYARLKSPSGLGYSIKRKKTCNC